MLVMMRAEMVVARREAVIGCRPLSDMVVAPSTCDSRFQTSLRTAERAPIFHGPVIRRAPRCQVTYDQAHCSNLVEQWLKEMMVTPAEERDTHRLVDERAGGAQPAEAAAHDDHVRERSMHNS
jgi:hypothetical protein